MLPQIAITAALCAASGFQDPIPGNKKNPLEPQAWVKLLGKDHLSDELQELRERLVEEPKVRYLTSLENKCFYHSWQRHGLQLRFNSDNKLESIFLYGGGDGFRAYKGPLPERLSFMDTMESVKKKLGTPADIGGGADVKEQCWWTYPANGLHVRFDTLDADDRKAKLILVIIAEPEPDKKAQTLQTEFAAWSKLGEPHENMKSRAWFNAGFRSRVRQNAGMPRRPVEKPAFWRTRLRYLNQPLFEPGQKSRPPALS